MPISIKATLSGLAVWWVCSMFSGCGSAQYAEVRRYLEHEDYARAQTQLEGSGINDALGWALYSECCFYQKDYLGLADAAHKSLAISGQYRLRIDNFLQRAFIEQLDAGIRAFNEGKDPEASRQFNQILVYGQSISEYMTPEMVETTQKVAALAGAVSIRLRDYPNARAYLEGLRADWKDNPALLERLAFIYYQLAEPQLCAAVCETLLVQQPRNGTVLQLRAEAYQLLGQPDAVVNAYRDALELSSQSPLLNRNIGITLFGLQDWKEARRHLEIACTMRPADSLELWIMIAECLYNEGDYHGALERFESVARSEPGNADVVRAIGACYRSLGDRRQSDAAFLEARRLTTGDSMGMAQDSSASRALPHSANGGIGK